MRTYIFLVILFLFIPLLASCSASSVHAALSWTIQTVDENGGGGNSPIVIDSENITHIAYTSLINGSYFVTYASWNGSGFSTQIIGMGQGVYSLVLDTNDNPHILYNNPYPLGGGNHLMYAIWTGTNWNIQKTGINEAYGILALDSYGNAHIAYSEGKAIKYAIWTGTNWNIQMVDSLPEGPIGISFALDANNTANILYHIPNSYQDNNTGLEYTSIEIKIATLKDSTWTIQTIPLPQPIYDNSNLVLDSKGYPHFVYTQDYYRSSEDVNLNYTVFYVSWDGSAWRTQTLISNFPAREYLNSPSGFLSLDSKDYPHIINFISESSRLTYSSWTGNNWNIIDSNISAIGPGYLTIDANGNPQISYVTFIGSNWLAPLMYATATETTQTPFPTVPVVTILTIVTVTIIVVFVAYVIRRKKYGV
jgi:hypothetical protein